MPSTSAAAPCFFLAAICAKSRLRRSAICPRRFVKALRMRRFSGGNRRPASGRNAMNRAMSSASIRSVFARTSRHRKRLDLCGRQLPGINARANECGPESPFPASSRLEANLRCSRKFADHQDQSLVAFLRICEAELLPAGKYKPVRPVAGNIYSDHGRCCYHVTLSSLCFGVPQTGRHQLFETVKEAGSAS